MTDPWEALMYAIVGMAVKDYRKAKDEAERREVERFFHSMWFEALTDVDGDVFLKRLKGMDGDVFLKRLTNANQA